MAPLREVGPNHNPTQYQNLAAYNGVTKCSVNTDYFFLTEKLKVISVSAVIAAVISKKKKDIFSSSHFRSENLTSGESANQ